MKSTDSYLTTRQRCQISVLVCLRTQKKNRKTIKASGTLPTPCIKRGISQGTWRKRSYYKKQASLARNFGTIWITSAGQLWRQDFSLIRISPPTYKLWYQQVNKHKDAFNRWSLSLDWKTALGKPRSLIVITWVDIVRLRVRILL